MKMNYLAPLLIVGLLILSSCKYSDEWKTVEAVSKDKKQPFSIQFPAYMEENKKHELHENAPVQYVNYFRNVYAIVNDTAGTDIFRKIADQELVELIAILEKPQILDTLMLTINNMSAVMAMLTGSVGVDDIVERIYYQVTVVQGKERTYRIILWTWDKNREKYREEFQKIAQSFKEL